MNHVYLIKKFVVARSITEAIRNERLGTIADVIITEGSQNNLIDGLKPKPTKKSPAKTLCIKPNG